MIDYDPYAGLTEKEYYDMLERSAIQDYVFYDILPKWYTDRRPVCPPYWLCKILFNIFY